MKSFHSLSPSDLLTLGTDQMGSHALQALITSSSDKGKGKMLRKLEVRYEENNGFVQGIKNTYSLLTSVCFSHLLFLVLSASLGTVYANSLLPIRQPSVGGCVEQRHN